MIKVTLFLTRRADLSFEEFSDYWINKHWPTLLSLDVVKEKTVRYSQQHRLNPFPEGLPTAPYDGYAEVWIESVDDFMAMVSAPEWASVVGKDELNFIDPAKTVILLTEEKVTYSK